MFVLCERDVLEAAHGEIREITQIVGGRSRRLFFAPTDFPTKSRASRFVNEEMVYYGEG
jgi:hypothetical protein